MDSSDLVTVITMLNKSLFTFRVRVPRRMIVDVHPVVMTFSNCIEGSSSINKNKNTEGIINDDNNNNNEIAQFRKAMSHAMPLRGN